MTGEATGKKKRLVLEISLGNQRWLSRSGEENIRNRGELRRFVLGLLRAGQDPSREDLATALREAPPDPERVARVTPTPEECERWTKGQFKWADIPEERRREAVSRAAAAILNDTQTICDYVARVYVLGHPRKPGRKRPSRTFAQERQIVADYFRALDEAREAREANSRLPRNVRTTVKRQIAAKHRIKTRTLETLIRGVRIGSGRGIRAKIYRE